MSSHLLFPKLQIAKFALVNLDSEARSRQSAPIPLRSERVQNPFLDAVQCDRFVESVARDRGVDFTYGGYLEDRRFIWSSSYLDTTKCYLHLGIDFNVPTGTEVACLPSGEVVVVDDDHPVEGGWGPRVIVRPDNGGPYCIFAHLQEVEVKVGDRLASNRTIGKVGAAPYNGNWYAHLHLQTVERASFERFMSRGLGELDGYGDEKLLKELPERYPDPLQFLWLVGTQFD